MRWAAAAVLLLSSCSSDPGAHLDNLFEQARADLWQGELAKAEAESERGLVLAGERHNLVSQWRFRLLRSEILLNRRRAEEVLIQLDDPALSGPPQPQLTARKKMLEG